MNKFKKIFQDYIGKKGYTYMDLNDITVSIPFAGENLKTVTITVAFKNDGGPVARFVSYNIGNIPANERINAISVCNKLNEDCSVGKFYLDGDNDVCVQYDLYFDENTCGPICMFIAKNLYMLVDECYPYFKILQA